MWPWSLAEAQVKQRVPSSTLCFTSEKYYRPDLFETFTGIGRCIAHELASLGATVVIAARKLEALESVQAEIRALGGVCDVMQINIRDASMATQLVQDIVAKHGKLTCLVVIPFSPWPYILMSCFSVVNNFFFWFDLFKE